MVRKITSIAFAFILLCVIVAGYLYYRQIAKPKNPIIGLVPTNACLIIRTKNLNKSFSKLEKSGIGASSSELSFFKELKQQVNQIDSTLKKNKIIYSESYFSLHPTSFGYNWFSVFSITPPKKFKFQISSNIENINIKKTKNNIYYFITAEVLVSSTNQNLVQTALKQLKSKNGLLQTSNFSSLYESSDKSAEVNLYVNYQEYGKYLNTTHLKSDEAFINRFKTFAGWSELDVHTNSSKISFQGYSNIGNFTKLSHLLDQEAQEMNITTVLPANTSSFFYFSFDDFSSYHNKRIENNKKDYLNFLKKTELKYGIALEDYFLSWIGNEICIGFQKSGSSNSLANSFGVIRSKDIVETKHILGELINQLSKKMNFEMESKMYRGHEIRFLNLKDILPNLMGPYFEKMNYNFFTTINDYVVFTNDYNSIQNIIDFYERNQTLSTNPDFINLSSQLEQKSNLFFYYNIPLSENEILQFIPQQLQSEFKSNYSNFKNIESACIQVTRGDENFYTNGIIQYNPDFKEVEIDKWETELLADISQTPQLVINKNTQQQELIVQDDLNNLYLLDLEGKVIFTAEVDDKILGSVSQIDFYKDGNYQYIYNTANKIYITDRKGKHIEYYPVKFKHKATNGLLVVDYENTKNYRFVLATENKEIVSITREARLTEGWNKFKLKNKVKTPLIYFTEKEKDYTYCKDESGKEYFIDRWGKGTSKTAIPKPSTSQKNIKLDTLSSNYSSFTPLFYSEKDSVLTHVITGKGKFIRSFRIN